MKHPFSTSLFLTVLLLGSSFSTVQAAPLSDTDILTLVGLEVPAADIVRTIDKSGYAGPTDDETLKKLLKAGAAPEVVLAAKLSATTAAQADNPPASSSDAPAQTAIDPMSITLGDLVKRMRDLGGFSPEEINKVVNIDHPIGVFWSEFDRAFKTSKPLASRLEAKFGLSAAPGKSVYDTAYALGAKKAFEACINAVIGESQAWPGPEYSQKLNSEQWIQRHGATRIFDLMMNAGREEMKRKQVRYYQAKSGNKFPVWAIEESIGMADFLGLVDGTGERDNYILEHAAKIYYSYYKKRQSWPYAMQPGEAIKSNYVSVDAALRGYANAFPLIDLKLDDNGAGLPFVVRLNQGQVVVHDGLRYSGFRFRVERTELARAAGKQPSDYHLAWFFMIPKGSEYMGWFITRIKGDMRGFSNFDIGRRSQYAGLEEWPAGDSGDFVIQTLAGDRLLEGEEYIIWFQVPHHIGRQIDITACIGYKADELDSRAICHHLGLKATTPVP